MHLTVDGVVHELSAGDTIFLPRGIPHTFRIKSGVARALTLISPSGFERWFQTIGTPAKNFDLPELTGPPSAETLERMKLLAAESGLRIVDNPSGR